MRPGWGRITYALGGAANYSSLGMSLADLDGDGRDELLLRGADDRMAILICDETGEFTEVAHVPVPFQALQMLARDLDHRWIVDLLARGNGVGVAVYKGLGGLSYASPDSVLSFAASANAWGTDGGVLLTDIDQDGREDMVGIWQYFFGSLSTNFEAVLQDSLKNQPRIEGGAEQSVCRCGRRF